MMQQQLESCYSSKVTLFSIIDSIEFSKSKKKKAPSETDSISSKPSTIDSELKQKSKIWNEEQVQMLKMSVQKYGTDFNILSSFFPKKTKNQIKQKYKQLIAIRKKEQKKQSQNLMAVAKMFQEVQEKQEQN